MLDPALFNNDPSLQARLSQTMTNPKALDAPSYLGQFGWETISDDLAIPVIVRNNHETLVRYSAVRIVEQEIIKKYDALPQNVFQCITLKSFYLTSCEAKLLNQINFTHCNNRYGDTFFGIKDVIISAHDAKSLARFLNTSLEFFTQENPKGSTVGIIRLHIDPTQGSGLSMLVPYLTKVPAQEGVNPLRFIPFKLVETYVKTSNSTVRAKANDWDIMYLKMLCIVCENNSQHLIERDSDIVRLDGLLYPKDNTPIIFEDKL